MQQRADNPDAQHGDGQPEGGALPMLYAAREEQQHDPGDARRHAGELDDAEGDPFPDLREPFGADGQDDVEAQDGSMPNTALAMIVGAKARIQRPASCSTPDSCMACWRTS